MSGVEEALLELVDAFVRNGRLIEAIRVLVNMLVDGFRVSVETFNVVSGALVKVKRDFRDVVLVYNEMVKSGVLPTVETLNYLIEGLLESGRIESALDQYRRMKKKGWSPNSRTFEIIIQALFAKDAKTHAFLIGSAVSDEVDRKSLDYDTFSGQDTVSNILAEGLDAT